MKRKQKRQVKKYNRIFRRRVRRAEKLAYQTDRKHYIMNFGGRLHIITYSELKRLIKIRYFRKGTKIESLLQRTLYSTTKQYRRNSEIADEQKIKQNESKVNI